MKFIDFHRLQLELEDIQNELMCLQLNTSDFRVGDFGCDTGYGALSLMLHFHSIECIGTDKFNTWELPTIEKAKLHFNTVQDAPAGSLSEKVKQLVDEERFPTFLQVDVLDAGRLPTNLDLAYCRLLLGNIDNEAYGNPPRSNDNLGRAIDNIVNCIKKGGLLCFVERADLKSLLTRPDLKLLRICHIERGEIEQGGRRSQVSGIRVYQYKKY